MVPWSLGLKPKLWFVVCEEEERLEKRFSCGESEEGEGDVSGGERGERGWGVTEVPGEREGVGGVLRGGSRGTVSGERGEECVWRDGGRENSRVVLRRGRRLWWVTFLEAFSFSVEVEEVRWWCCGRPPESSESSERPGRGGLEESLELGGDLTSRSVSVSEIGGDTRLEEGDLSRGLYLRKA